MRKEFIEMMMPSTIPEKMILEIIKEEGSFSSIRTTVPAEEVLRLGNGISIRRHDRYAGCSNHGHNYVEMMYVINGSITHIIDGKTIVMKSGDILIMNKYIKHEVKVCGKDDIAVNICFTPEFFDNVLRNISAEKNNMILDFVIDILNDTHRARYLYFENSGDIAIDNIMENIIVPYITEKKINELIYTTTISLLFLHLMNSIEELKDKTLDNYNDVVAELALSYIENNYKTASLAEMADALNQSYSTLSKIIKNATGCTYNELLKRKRLKSAAILLVETDMNISDIMNACGYENSSHFYNSFKEQYSLSPKEYRRLNKDKEKVQI